MIIGSDIAEWFKSLQDEICAGIEKADGGRFREDLWERPGGGGGRTRILNGNVIEKGGVNFSLVEGKAPEFLLKQNNLTDPETRFFASGVSIVMHPVNPFVPIIHMNVRYLTVGKKWWFGGGIDLTPHYVKSEDAVFFHNKLKAVCDEHGSQLYDEYKKQADDYFFLSHRNETRGIGGIFFDHQSGETETEFYAKWDFVRAVGKSFLPIYTKLIESNRNAEYDANHVRWQRIRRGRYVEFNLLYDRGTKFGLDTNGRTESILMSLPPLAQWEYDYKPEENSPEQITLSLLKKDIDWLKK
jgi:coproporphyrinogen III oxidase